MSRQCDSVDDDDDAIGLVAMGQSGLLLWQPTKGIPTKVLSYEVLLVSSLFHLA